MTMPTPSSGNDFSAASQGTLLGTNSLQSSIDNFTRTVDRLSSVVSGMACPTGGTGSTYMQTSPGMGQAGQGQTFTAGMFPRMMSMAPSNQGAYTNPPSGQFQGASVVGQQGAAQSAAAYGGAGGGSGNVPGFQAMSAAGNGGYGAALGLGIGAGILGAVTSFGKSQLPIQMSMNAYYQQAKLAAPGASWSSIYTGAFGNYNTNLNALALSPYDAAQGAALMQYYSGGQPTLYGQPMTGMQSATYSAAAAAGYTNPSLGYAGAAKMAGQLYNPQTSLAMRTLGYGVTPRQMGTGSFASSGQVIQGFLQRWYGPGTTSVKASTLDAGLAQGGRANLNLQALGLNPQQWTPVIQAYNQLYSKGVSPSRANTLFEEAAKNQDGAQNTLNRYGISNSEIQLFKNNQAQQTGRSSGESQSFNSAVSTATTGLNEFNKALNNILNGPLGNAAGYAGGMAGVMGSSGGGGLLGGLTNGLGLFGAARLLGFGGKGGLAGGILGGLGGKGAGGLLSRLGGSALLRTGGALGLEDILGRLGMDIAPKQSGHAAGSGGILGSIDKTVYGSGVQGFANWAQSHITDPAQHFINSAAHDIGNVASSGWHAISGIFGGAGGGITVGGSVFAGSHSSGPSSGNNNGGGPVSGQVNTAVKDALQQVGKPYVWGGDNPQTSFDCSGLVEWSYAQAGVKLPRTSQQQWASLKNKSVPLNKVKEGDIIFTAGSDGTASSPGHEALMISNSQIVEAAHTGTNIRVRAYSPNEWQHAARPVGPGGSSGGGNGSGNSNQNGSSSSGNAGTRSSAGMGLAPGAYGSSEEAQNVSAALLTSLTGTPPVGGTNSNNNGTSGTSGKGAAGKNIGGGGVANPTTEQKYAFSLFSKFGWGSSQQEPLVKLWTQESGWNANAVNPSSQAYGIPQALPGAQGHPYPLGQYQPQIQWGENYIKNRYGSPAAAWAHEQAFNWYAAGTGNATAGIALVGDRGPELVSLSGGQKIMPASKTAEMLNGTSALPAQGPWKTGPLTNLFLANMPQNTQHAASSVTIQLNFPANGIQIHMPGTSSSDVSNAVQQVMHGVTQAMAENQMIQNIAAGRKN